MCLQTTIFSLPTYLQILHWPLGVPLHALFLPFAALSSAFLAFRMLPKRTLKSTKKELSESSFNCLFPMALCPNGTPASSLQDYNPSAPFLPWALGPILHLPRKHLEATVLHLIKHTVPAIADWVRARNPGSQIFRGFCRPVQYGDCMLLCNGCISTVVSVQSPASALHTRCCALIQAAYGFTGRKSG